MTDETRVVAQAGNYRILADGTMQTVHAHLDEWVNLECRQQSQDLAALLADAARRVREEMGKRVAGLSDDLQAQIDEIDEGNKVMAGRIKTLERGFAAIKTAQYPSLGSGQHPRDDENPIRMPLEWCLGYDLGREEARAELTERIEAVEKAIVGTRVDQGEMDLVSEQDARDIRRKLEELEQGLAGLRVAYHCTDEANAGGLNNLANRINKGEQLARRQMLHEVDAETRRRVEDVQVLADRVAALENGMPKENIQATANRVEEIADRLAAVEMGARDHGWIGGVPADRDGIRRELAREIVERLRGDKNRAFRDCTLCDALNVNDVADWIKREYCGEEGEDEG